jgi:hypothetical protein
MRWHAFVVGLLHGAASFLPSEFFLDTPASENGWHGIRQAKDRARAQAMDQPRIRGYRLSPAGSRRRVFR